MLTRVWLGFTCYLAAVGLFLAYPILSAKVIRTPSAPDADGAHAFYSHPIDPSNPKG